MTTSLKNIQSKIQDSLSAIGVSGLQIQAEIRYISEYILALPEASQWLDPEQEIPEHLVAQIEMLLKKRVDDRIPIQYLVSTAYFYGLPYYVDSHVLIPRPETEHLLDLALSFVKDPSFKTIKTILDLGTGSGIIPIALAHQLKEAGQTGFSITGVDISAKALEVAQKNALTHEVEGYIQWAQGDLFQPVSHQTFDLILSNPPYIEHTEATSLLPEVYDHEPHLALFTPEGEPSFYERIAREAKNHLNQEGVVIVELGYKCRASAEEAFKSSGFSAVTIHQDYAGIDRILVASF